jgi:hypothetical protein
MILNNIVTSSVFLQYLFGTSSVNVAEEILNMQQIFLE